LPDDEKRTYENRVVTFFLARLPVTEIPAVTAAAPAPTKAVSTAKK